MKTTRLQEFLKAKIGSVSSDLKTKLDANAARFADVVYYIRKAVAGGGILPLLESTDDVLIGVTNISKQKLNDNVMFAAGRIELRAAWQSAATVAQGAIYTDINGVIADPALTNAELEITLDDQKIIQIPVSDFISDEPEQGGHKAGFNLETPILWTDKQRLGFRLHTANGQTYTTGAGKLNFIEVRIKGVQIQPR